MSLRAQTILRRLIIGLSLSFVVLPYVPLLIWSFAFRWNFPNLLPSAWSLRPWQYIAAPESQVGPALLNSLGLALAVTAVAMLIGVPAGRALGMYQFRGKSLIEFLILLPVIVPSLAVVLGMHVVLIRYRLADTWLGVALVHLIPTTPYVTMLMAGVFANYDPQFEQQARVLGATPHQTLLRVTLPILLPGISVAALFAFLISWSQYALSVIVGGGSLITLPMLLFAFARSGDNAIAAALALVFIAPALLLLLATSRFLSGDHTAIGGLSKL